MPAENEQLLTLLKDPHVLRLAYTASSDYAMQLSFEQIGALQSFRRRIALAPSILEQYQRVMEQTPDTVILGAHLYALGLTGGQDALRKAVVETLDQHKLRQDPMLTQMAGKIASRLLRRKLPLGKDLTEQDLEEIHSALRKEIRP